MAESKAIVWDKEGSKYYEMGVTHGVLYTEKTIGSVTKKYGVPWNGLTSVSESPDGAEPNDLYADDIKYAVLRSAETFGATIEAYTYPDEFAECDGSVPAVDGVYVGQQKRKPFGFCYRTTLGSDTLTGGNEAYKLHIIYNASASPSDKSYETINDSPDAITFSWEISTTPVNVTINGETKSTSTIVIDSNKCDADALKALENALYGTADADPYLPDPNEVLGFFKKS